MQIKYIAFDNKEFENKEDCERYEAQVEKDRELMMNLQFSTDGLDSIWDFETAEMKKAKNEFLASIPPVEIYERILYDASIIYVPKECVQMLASYNKDFSTTIAVLPDPIIPGVYIFNGIDGVWMHIDEINDIYQERIKMLHRRTDEIEKGEE